MDATGDTLGKKFPVSCLSTLVVLQPMVERTVGSSPGGGRKMDSSPP